MNKTQRYVRNHIRVKDVKVGDLIWLGDKVWEVTECFEADEIFQGEKTISLTYAHGLFDDEIQSRTFPEQMGLSVFQAVD